MREVVVSETVLNRVSELKDFLLHELNLSEETAQNYVGRIERFLLHLGSLVDYPPCRFKRWHEKGYHCAVFEKNWVFAYEIFVDGIIIRDMSNTALLNDPITE